MFPLTPEETLKPKLNINAQLFIHCVVSHASLHHGTVDSFSSLHRSAYVFRQLAVQPSLATMNRNGKSPRQSAALCQSYGKTERAPANHVNASQRTTFPDASVFLFTDALRHVWVCECVCVSVCVRIS